MDELLKEIIKLRTEEEADAYSRFVDKWIKAVSQIKTIYKLLVGAGFTEEQAFELLKIVLKKGED